VAPRKTPATGVCYNHASNELFNLGEDLFDKRFIRTNDRIRAREIRVIDDEGQQIGILPPFEALKMARAKNLDLVEFHPQRIHLYAESWTSGNSCTSRRKRTRGQEAPEDHRDQGSEVRINVDDHDYETKKNHVLRFLDEGDKVKATIFFRGREMTRTGLGREILERLIKRYWRPGNRGIPAASGRQHAALDPGAEAKTKPGEKSHEKPQHKAAPHRNHPRKA